MHLLQWAEAERDFQRAIELNPNYASAHQWYATIWLSTDASTRRWRGSKCPQARPVVAANRRQRGEFLYFARRNDEAIETVRKTLELDPNFLASRINLGRAY
jgi:tetratricopeptide (TPR) repeat protein